MTSNQSQSTPSAGGSFPARTSSGATARGADSRVVVLDDEGNLQLAFPYEPGIVAMVRGIPGRRFDGNSKTWTVPVCSEAKALVERYKFTVAVPNWDSLAFPLVNVGRLIASSDDALIFQFQYDKDIVDKMRNLPGRRFDGDKKVWTVPFSGMTATVIQNVIAFAEENGFTIESSAMAKMRAVAQERKSAVDASLSLSADLAIAGLKHELLPFQKAGIAYALKHKRVFLADEVGLGKTVQSIATVIAADAFPVLVVTKASLKYAFAREVKKWTNRTAVVLDGDEGGREAYKADFVILNYDVLEKWIDLLAKIPFKAFIGDECHYLKNGKAKRTKFAKMLAKNEYRLMMSATNLTSRPLELVSQLDILGRLEEFGGYRGFTARYCDAHYNGWGWDLRGSSNEVELNERLRALCFVRRSKKEVMPELPDVQTAIVPVNLTNRAEYNRVAHNVAQWLGEKALQGKEFEDYLKTVPQDQRDGVKRARRMDAEYKALRAETLVRIESLKQVAAKGKLAAVKEWLTDFLESGEKIIVFATHTSIIKELATAFNAPMIAGDTPSKQRLEIVDKFQNDPSVKIVICNTQAAGEGLTMTAAKNVAFVEMEWTPARHDQAIGRVYGRLNDAHGATAWYLVGTNCIDEWIAELLETKRKVVNAVLTGEAIDDDAEQLSIMGSITERILEAA